MKPMRRAFRIDEGPARVFRGDRGSLSRPRKMANGFLQTDAYFTRVGVFEYRNSDGSVRRELRLPSEVFKPDSMATFAMAPFTNGHPPVPVTPANSKSFSVGYTGQDVRRDGEKMRGTVVVSDAKTIRQMKRGKRQVSNGYFCDLDPTSGVTKGIEGIPDGLQYDCIQRNIEGNHVALVERARAGSDVEVRVDESFRVDGVDDVAVMVWHDDAADDPGWDDLEIDDPAGGDDPAGNADVDDVFSKTLQQLKKVQAKDSAPFHLVGMVAIPIIMEMGLTITEVAQALGTSENEAENILSGEVMPTGLQLEGLASLLDVPADDLKDLLPERQRELTDQEGPTMEEFEITINGVTFKMKGDSAARQAVTKKLHDDEAMITSLKARVTEVEDKAKADAEASQAKLDEAKEKGDGLQAKLDDATDPDKLRKRIDERLDLERDCKAVLGDKFDAKMDDDDLRRAVIAELSPNANLDGKSDAYVQARYDAAVEGFDADKTQVEDSRDAAGRLRAAAHNTRRVDNGVGEHSDAVAEAKAKADKKRRDMASQPLGFSKDGPNAIA